MQKIVNVSIVVVSWNTRDILRDCLKSIDENAGFDSYETIVVDNASADGSAEMVRREFPHVRLIENAENRGFAAANNQGIAIAQGRYVLLLNSDTIVLDGAIAKTVAFADAHPDAAVVGCRVLNADRTLQPTCFMFPSLLNMLLSSTYLYKLWPHSRFFGRERMTWWERDDVCEVEVVDGCYMVVRREAIDQVGLLDETFFMYGEETDWCYRFQKGGWKNLFHPDAQIIHLGGQSSKIVKTEMVYQLRAGILQFVKKHHGPARYRAACLLVSLWFAIRVPYWLLKSLSGAGRRSEFLAIAMAYVLGSLRAMAGYQALCCRRSGMSVARGSLGG